MIMITHDLGIVAETCDRVAVMYAGKIIEEGNLDEVFQSHTASVYRGAFQLSSEYQKQAEQAGADPRSDAGSHKSAQGLCLCTEM